MACSSAVERLTVNQVVAGSIPAGPVASLWSMNGNEMRPKDTQKPPTLLCRCGLPEDSSSVRVPALRGLEMSGHSIGPKSQFAGPGGWPPLLPHCGQPHRPAFFGSPDGERGTLRSRHRSRMEYVVKFPTRPRTQSLTCGASLRVVLPLVLLDETLLPANQRALLEAMSPHLCASLRRLT